MVTVSTKAEFNNALKSHEKQIRCVGEMAEVFKKKRKTKRAAVATGIAAIIGGVTAIPFTGGASAVGAVAGVAGLTVGTISISAAELAILFGGTIATIGVVKGCKVKFEKGDISVIVEPRY